MQLKKQQQQQQQQNKKQNKTGMYGDWYGEKCQWYDQVTNPIHCWESEFLNLYQITHLWSDETKNHNLLQLIW